MYKIKVITFKETGKYNTEAEIETDREFMFEVSQDVKEMIKQKKVPGLIEGATPPYVLIDGIDHPKGYPCLLISDRITSHADDE
jgi:hypothetical protein